VEQVIRHRLIDELDAAISGSSIVTLSAPAGGGVSTALDQWMRHIRLPVMNGVCPDFAPQRPLAAFSRVADEETAALIIAADWKAAAAALMRRFGREDRLVVVIDDADHLDEASARLARELLGFSCRLVIGHHHAPPTNPSLEMLIESTTTKDRSSVDLPPLDEAEVGSALGENIDAGAARVATGGNPLALSMYRGSGFASIATAVLERFDRLTADGQALAAILAASPEPVSLELLDSMGRPWGAHGGSLDRNGLATVTEDRAALGHDKIRRVLYEEMTALRRRFVHAEMLGQLSDADDLTLVMHHAVGAGDVEQIISLGPVAAEQAAALGSYREAARHLANVLAYEHSIPEADRRTIRASLEQHLAEVAV
jgi:hypothetical protein